MLAPYLRKSPTPRFIGTITSLKKKPTRIKTAPPAKPLYNVVYQFSKDKIFKYVNRAGEFALKNVSRIARLGYNYCLPHNKLVTADELRIHLTTLLEEHSDSSIVVKIRTHDGTIFIGGIYSTVGDNAFVLKCWSPEQVTIDIRYNDVVHVHFMSDASDYEII